MALRGAQAAPLRPPASLVARPNRRWERHSAISAGKYASREEMKRWQKTDPIPRFRALLSDREGVPSAELDSIDTAVKRQVDEAVEFALASPPASVSEIEQDIFA